MKFYVTLLAVFWGKVMVAQSAYLLKSDRVFDGETIQSIIERFNRVLTAMTGDAAQS